jgi:hypothetical protein
LKKDLFTSLALSQIATATSTRKDPYKTQAAGQAFALFTADSGLRPMAGPGAHLLAAKTKDRRFECVIAVSMWAAAA